MPGRSEGCTGAMLSLSLFFFYLCAHIGKQSMSTLAGTHVSEKFDFLENVRVFNVATCSQSS